VKPSGKREPIRDLDFKPKLIPSVEARLKALEATARMALGSIGPNCPECTSPVGRDAGALPVHVEGCSVGVLHRAAWVFIENRK
jgi:hypothetical protein